MGSERPHLGADHHLGADSVLAQQKRCRRGTLETKHSLRVEDAGEVYRVANVISTVRAVWPRSFSFSSLYLTVQSVKISERNDKPDP
jgi:hypothetical protein